jgi:hypothetical protein
LRYLRTSLIRCAPAGVRCVANAAIQWSPRFQMLKGLRKTSGEGGICLSMLPGFRFLFAATFLSMSILVFGLGAAALLRAAHEQFASNPSWHAAPEATFAQQVEATRPVLAMLRVDPPAAEQKASGNAPAPDEQTARTAPAVPPPAEPVSVAALKQEAPPAAARPDIPASENPAPSQLAAAPSDTPAADATKVAAPAALSEANVASTAPAAAEPVSQTANEGNPAAREIDATASSPAGAPAAPEADIASTTIATLDNPSVTVEPAPPAKIVNAKSDQSALKKRLRARRAAHRRRMAARQALLLAQQQQAANPFAQPFAQPQPAAAATAARAR